MENIKSIIHSAEEITNETLFPEPDFSIIKDSKLPPPPFLLDVFNEKWQNIMRSAAEAKACPIDYVAMSFLVAAGSLIGCSRQVVAWNGSWKQYPLLWAMLIGDPSSKKSPSLQIISDALKGVEYEILIPYEKAKAKYAAAKSLAEIQQQDWKKKCEKALNKGEEIPPHPDCANLHAMQPARPRLVLNDATIEKIVHILRDNTKGVLLLKDELSDWLLNMKRHGGSDQEFFLPAYDGAAHHVDRVKYDEPLIVDRLVIPIIGGIQPEKLESVLLKQVNDGFAARFLPIWPTPVQFKRPQTDLMGLVLHEAFRRFQALELSVSGENKQVPVSVPLANKANDVLEEWYKIQPEREIHTDSILKGYIGKMPGVVLRLSLIFAYMDWVLETHKSEPKEIAVRYIRHAINFVDAYLIPMGRRTYAEAALPQEQRDAKRLAHWLLANRTDTLNAREISRMAGSPIRDVRSLKAALTVLNEYNWIMPIPKEQQKSAGRPKADYIVNPKIYEDAMHH